MTNLFLPCTNERPKRFFKPPFRATSSDLEVSDDMRGIVDLFEHYAKKKYQEGYILKHNTGGLPTHLFAELEGSTLSLWDAGNSNGMVQPQFIQITENTVIECEQRNQKHLFSLFFKEKKSPCRMLFEALDNASLVRWITAFYLSNFERQKLYQLFTLKLIVPHISSSIKKKKAGYLQVRRPGMQWKKYWVIISTKKRRLFNIKSKKRVPSIQFYEKKKSRKPVFTLDQLTDAYAIYPETTCFIEKRSMIKLENTQESCLIMVEDNQYMKECLLTIYNLFRLFNTSDQQQLTDSTYNHSLNYAENEINKETLYLHVNDVISKVDLEGLSKVSIFTIFDTTLKDILDGTHTPIDTVQNDLPTNIQQSDLLTDTTNASINDDGLSKSDVSFKETPFIRCVADSSDESESDERDDDEEDDDFDSDNEPIGRRLEKMKLKGSLSTIPKAEDISTPIPEKVAPSPFGEFNLSTDFENILNVSIDKRKCSLPDPSVSSSNSVLFKERRRSWQEEWRSEDLKTLDDSFDSAAPRFEVFQHGLLDQYINQKLTAKEQIEYSKATGEPLVQVSVKPRSPSQGGLVGMVPQSIRRTGNEIRRIHADKLDRERLLMENQLMQQQLLMYNIYHTQNYQNYQNYPMSIQYPFYHSMASPLPSPHDTNPSVYYGSMRSLPQLYHARSQSSVSYQHKRRSTKSLVDDDIRTPPKLKKKSIQINRRI